MKKLFEATTTTYQQPGVGTQGSYLAVTAAVGVIVAWVAGSFGVVIPMEVTAAVGTLLGFIGGKLGT